MQTFGIVAMTNAAYYLAFTFAVERRKQPPETAATFPAREHGEPVRRAVRQAARRLAVGRIGRRRLMMALTVATMPLIYVALQAMLYGSPREFIGGQFLMAVPLGMALGLQGAMLVEIFPLRTRVTSMSLAYSITLALAGGMAPLVATWLIEPSGSRSRRRTTSWSTARSAWR